MENNRNVEKLEAAGMITEMPLPEAYAEVLQGLSDEEVEVMVSVKQRLDEACVSHGLTPDAVHARYIVI